MSDVTAIDILINPDEAERERVRAVNGAARERADRFRARCQHEPHITTLQRLLYGAASQALEWWLLPGAIDGLLLGPVEA